MNEERGRDGREGQKKGRCVLQETEEFARNKGRG
jgi:hypothetical protein